MAALSGRDYVLPDDVKALAAPVLAHRLVADTAARLRGESTATIVAELKHRFPAIRGPHKEDICYATTNRQQAVQAIAGRCQAVLIIGAPNSSNSLRLVEVARAAGCAGAALVVRAADIDWPALAGVRTVGVSAGASAPEQLVGEVIAALGERFRVSIEEVAVAQEDVRFRLPHELAG